MAGVRSLMVQGTSSWAGKSLIATALCRHYARLGIKVAPFKAQNMSNNACVVAGGEIGVAQYLQARAARVAADVRMNPVLVKPEGDNRSQVIVDGRVEAALSALSWRERAPLLWPAIEAALGSLGGEFELLVVEGAGSPAEINLASSDLANMRIAAALGASVLLVAHIDRGGAFAHLYGTWALLAPEERAQVRGFVLNKLRGDAGLLPPAPEELERLTGTPVVGVIPWLRHWLPDEDGAASAERLPAGAPVVALVRYPYASNLDEFKLLEQVATLVSARSPTDLQAAELIVLPGSKHVAADLDWLRGSGLAASLLAAAAQGRRILGVCGGMQMLGGRLRDPYGIDGAGAGLGLLPVETVFEREKLVRLTEVVFGDLHAPWSELRGYRVGGYEIRHGRLRRPGRGGEAPAVVGVRSVLGVAAHGLFEDPELVERLLGVRPKTTLDVALDRLADEVVAHLDLDPVEAAWR